MLATIRKALIAAGGAEAAGLGAAMLDGNISLSEVIAATGAALVFGFAAWRVPNASG